MNTAVEYAIERKILIENPPSSRAQEGEDLFIGSRRPARSRDQGGSRSIARCGFVRREWDRKKGRRLVAFYAVMYFAALRRSEAAGLRKSD
ncbi:MULTISPECIES: site-specific integrase [Streptomyces]|uniref:hypothetical protein n=1 Tax=Streptomyces TaxID=1883 RepID=UPI002180C612|nr:hypothetical protein [Streptomyces sp. gCLA4]